MQIDVTDIARLPNVGWVDTLKFTKRAAYADHDKELGDQIQADRVATKRAIINALNEAVKVDFSKFQPVWEAMFPNVNKADLQNGVGYMAMRLVLGHKVPVTVLVQDTETKQVVRADYTAKLEKVMLEHYIPTRLDRDSLVGPYMILTSAYVKSL